MKEKPIIFSGPEVRAILDGKTQTRRVTKWQPNTLFDRPFVEDEWSLPGFYAVRGAAVPNGTALYRRYNNGQFGILECPYGQPGDRLWVRETWRQCYPETSYSHGVIYRADKAMSLGMDEYSDRHKWKPSIHMPRRFSRITLEIKNIRVERVQEISEQDCAAEGVVFEYPDLDEDPMAGGTYFRPGRHGFAQVWDSINGKPKIERDDEGREIARHDFSWSANPWCWVIEFVRVEPRDA